MAEENKEETRQTEGAQPIRNMDSSSKAPELIKKPIDSFSKNFGLMPRIVIIMMSFAALVTSGYAFLFFLFAMLPTIVVILIDRRIGKCASSTIGAFNLIGVMPHLMDLWRSGDIRERAQNMLTDINVWVFIYGFCALGWLVIWSMPQLWSSIFLARANAKVRNLRAKQEDLVDEWGPEVRTEHIRKKRAMEKKRKSKQQLIRR